MGRCLLVAVWLALAINADAAESVNVTPSAIPGVEVSGPPSAEYTAATDQFFASTRSQNLTNWLPFGVAITNRTAQPIAAVAICWQVTAQNGATYQYRLEYEAFDRPNAQLAPGQTGIAVGLNLILDPTRLPPQLRQAASQSTVQNPGNLPDFVSAQSVQATLDGVVFASGQFVGPDDFKEYESYVANATVPRRVAAQVLAKKGAGDSAATIAAWLKTRADQAVNSQTGEPWDAIAEIHTARQLLGTYDQGGEEQLYQAAQHLARKPALTLYR